jgi:hypothetical protein
VTRQRARKPADPAELIAIAEVQAGWLAAHWPEVSERFLAELKDRLGAQCACGGAAMPGTACGRVLAERTEMIAELERKLSVAAAELDRLGGRGTDEPAAAAGLCYGLGTAV